MRHLFIINPVAGGKKNCSAETERQIRAAMDTSTDSFEIYTTKAPMDAAEKIRLEAASGDMLRVYACGGDGTLNECVNGAAGWENVAVTHFPCGTGNDFIKMFGAEGARFRELAELIHGEVHPIDLIKCNDRYSVNICSVGIDARIGTDVHKYSHFPVIGGATGYVVSLVVNVAKGVAERYVVKTERTRRDGEFSLICVCNGRFYGGGFNPVADARPDDGLMDTLIVKKVSRARFFQLVGLYAKGKYYKLKNLVERVSGKSLTVESEQPFVINVDGELLRDKRAEFSLIPGGINFIFPPQMQFFEYKNEKIEENMSKEMISGATAR